MHSPAGNLRVLDFDVWYSDPNDWNVDRNWWLDPNDADDANDAPDPHAIGSGDPNDPTYNDPNDPNYNRWAELSGGPPISTGLLNSELLYLFRYGVMLGEESGEATNLNWDEPWGPWTIQLADANYLDPSGTPSGPVQMVIDRLFWIDGEFPLYCILRLDGAGGVARSLNLEVTNPSKGEVNVSPDWPRLWPKFPDGMTITLEAVPTEGSFKEWVIFDPNFPGDTSHAVKDTNAVIELTMDADHHVEAKFKCGSSEILPLVGVVLLVLALGVMIRRPR